MKGLVLLSGGIDSTVCLYIAERECEEVGALSFLYGQKHTREIEAAVRIAKYVGAKSLIQQVPASLFEGAQSSLVGKQTTMPHVSYEHLRQTVGPSPTYVPFRNGIFLSMAAATALTRGYDCIYFGAHADDAHNWAYPDCAPQFISAMRDAIYVGTYKKVRLEVPLMQMTKTEIISRGVGLGVPFELTYSCYEGGEFHCAKCPTCINRKEAFKQAGIVDPTEYEE